MCRLLQVLAFRQSRSATRSAQSRHGSQPQRSEERGHESQQTLHHAESHHAVLTSPSSCQTVHVLCEQHTPAKLTCPSHTTLPGCKGMERRSHKYCKDEWRCQLCRLGIRGALESDTLHFACADAPPCNRI